ncbi:MAG TPA: two-component system response regulator [Elusimicrobia bacterium]|nr:two-component system response regulator [Elusimicrobiota bacterium]HBT60972.1 two-component system response regulator [Elusimicrobiota bacterium]
MAKKVMVIDDEPEMLNLVQFTLERGGFEVATCDNGRQAWDAIIQFKPDLLILDVMLPGIDGYSLQIKLAQEAATKSMPIIVLTALEPAKTLFQKFPQVVGFMTKPFKTEELLENVQSALSRQSPANG